MFKYLALLGAFVAPSNLIACSFCGGNPAGRSTLREEFMLADAVVFGTLKNPQLGSDPTTGTTEFHFARVLKPHAIIEKRTMFELPKYLPTPMGQTVESVIFFADRKGKCDAVRSQTANAALVDYLAAITKIDAKDTTARLAFAFKHLDAGDPTISDDAFMEFAKAGDDEILKAKAHLDPTKIKLMLKNPKTPASRLGVYALLLGLCGEKADAAVLAGMIDAQPGVVTGGLLTGVTLLNAEMGWKEIASYALDSKLDYGLRLSALSAGRYMQDTRPAESKGHILNLYKGLLNDPEVADLAIEHLRSWKLWDLTPEVLKLYGQPKSKAKVMIRAILRYALTCPDAAAKEFVAAVRKQDAALVKDMEERIKVLEK